MPRPKPLSRLKGGRSGFDRSHAAIASASAQAQQRFSDGLDALGPPGATRWDPMAGEIELRGRVFQAEQLGSFDGESWLWSWANDTLKIPTDKTQIARRLRRRGGVFDEPMIAVADERLPSMMGDFAIAYAGVGSYWIANQTQVYVLPPGQLETPRLRQVALCFTSRSTTLRAVEAHLAPLGIRVTAPNVLEVVREGATVRVTRSEALQDVRREAKRVGEHAKTFGAVLICRIRHRRNLWRHAIQAHFRHVGPERTQHIL